MSDPKPAGELVDALGIQCTVDDTELVSGGVLILNVIAEDGSVRLSSWWSDGVSWLEKVGMLRIAEKESSSLYGYLGDDDDD